MQGITLISRGMVSLIFPLLLLTPVLQICADKSTRFHEKSEYRRFVPRTASTAPPTPGPEYDTVAVENYLRSYRHGSGNQHGMLYNHDIIAAYVGPAPTGHPDVNITKGWIRTWAMFDYKTKKFCIMNAVHDYGELALFSCPVEGVYRAYAIETEFEGLPKPDVHTNNEGKTLLRWHKRSQLSPFDLLGADHTQRTVFRQTPNNKDSVGPTDDRIKAMEHWLQNITYAFVGSQGSPVPLTPATRPIVVSDPIRVKESYYCYYWMFMLRGVTREGYVDRELIPSVDVMQEKKSGNKEAWTASILLDIFIWIAEPGAVAVDETLSTLTNHKVSEYSKVVTKRFAETGLYPCLRRAHSAVEVIQDMTYTIGSPQSNHLADTPHWRARIKIHTDRLISTLSDITFTIASRQNAASFHCFVGDSRVYIKLRDFRFVPIRKLQVTDINLNASRVYEGTETQFRFDEKPIYGHGVHHIGYKWSKKFQPASTRSDMIVIPNPCIVQEFAFSVGGSLYIAEGLLRKGIEEVKPVSLPFFPLAAEVENITSKETREYLRIFDVAFTPTHVAFLMAEGYILLHSSSAKVKGVGEISEIMKYRPDAFVKRKWCPRTASPKLSAQMLPIFGEGGHIVILQVYLTEGNVPMWVTDPAPTCLSEGEGFVKKLDEITSIINETDIHYEDFAAVVRTDQKTGLVEPPVPSRPPPPPPPERDIYEETSFILDSERNFVVEGEDPHFPLERIDPASHILENKLKNYNQAKIYIVEDNQGFERLLTDNGVNSDNTKIRIAAMEFAASEKQFIVALTFSDPNIKFVSSTSSSAPKLQALITTLTVTNFPYRVKLEHDASVVTDEKLDVEIPFPGVLLIRLNHFEVDAVKSRDPFESAEHAKQLAGSNSVAFVPEIHVLGTGIPSYVVNLGNVLMLTSVEGRYARPLHYFPWEKVDQDAIYKPDAPPLTFNDSKITIVEKGSLYDLVVTEQGMISLLRRKSRRHLVMDDVKCIKTPDADIQRAILGSVVTLEGLRELKPFFRNDNIFQRGTPDGEVIYGVYDVKPRSSYKDCPPNTSADDTKDDPEPCIHQATEAKPGGRLIPVCGRDQVAGDSPCRDPGYIKYCPKPNQPDPDKTHACLRCNAACRCDTRTPEEPEAYVPPSIENQTACDEVETTMVSCLPVHAPRESLRSVNILGTSYHSILQGSLQNVRSLHPEAGDWKKEVKEELDLCPFGAFDVHHKQIDFAEVGYQIRITAQVSYIGTNIPPEADILVEYERTMGVVIDISTSVETIRQITNIIKAVDIHFHMPDYKLEQLMNPDPAEKHRQRQLGHDFDDVRAREKFSVLSITFRPSIVNMHCKSTDMFKTIQYNVGCNSFSTIRLMSEATALKLINWTETLDEQSGFRWHRNYDTWNLTIPKVHIFYRQLKGKKFRCQLNPSFCEIPYFHLFKNEIYTLSYRDYFLPKFEQFLTFSSRPVTGNVVIYDLLGSNNFNWTLNKYKADCYNLAHYWYEKLLHGTKDIHRETFEHENVYLYFRDCFDLAQSGAEDDHQRLLKDPFYLFNDTNGNSIKFWRNRNEIFIFRAVVINTYYNRFTYCKHLDTFFMVRITGIPIPRQGLALWHYVLTMLTVFSFFVVWYFTFARFYTWTVPHA